MGLFQADVYPRDTPIHWVYAVVTPVLGNYRGNIYEHTALTYMNKKVVFLVIMLMFTVSLSGCLGRGGGNGNGDKNMGSPEEVKAEDYNVLYIGHSFGRVFAETLQIMHTPQDSPFGKSALRSCERYIGK